MTRRDRRSPAPRRRSTARVAAALVPALLLTSCTSGGDGGGDGGAEPTTPASPSASEAVLDLSAMPVDRADPCPVLLEDDVVEALGTEVARTAHYGNGEEAEVTPGVVDVSHEYGCVFEAADGTAARLWVFARPVLLGEARTLVRRTRDRDCAFPEPLVFGDPGVVSVCEVPSSGRGEQATFRARFEGLFADTWVGCEVSEPAGVAGATGSASPPTRQDVLQRAEEWCTAAVTSAAAAS